MVTQTGTKIPKDIGQVYGPWLRPPSALPDVHGRQAKSDGTPACSWCNVWHWDPQGLMDGELLVWGVHTGEAGTPKRGHPGSGGRMHGNSVSGEGSLPGT